MCEELILIESFDKKYTSLEHREMERTLGLLVVALMAGQSWAAGAGRAFPIDSENFAIRTFKGINSALEWDTTNFLVDLSGEYANCNYLNQRGPMKADRKTPEGAPVTVVIDTTQGKDTDVTSVNQYITDVISRWETSRQYHTQIREARRVGCSVRPACSGYAVIACLFSSGQGQGLSQGQDNDRGNFQLPKRPPTEIKNPWEDRENQKEQYKRPEFLDEKPKAEAFTPDQYRTAESIMGKTWDRAHFLENLSGFETDCSMTLRTDWPFNYAKEMMHKEKIKITGQYGHAVNKGSTPDALREVLSSFKPIHNAKSIGCSLIPHCRNGPTMYVVVSCLYEEN